MTQDSEETCGQELAASAVVPEQVAALFEHVAGNLRDHAAWVGDATPDAKREQDAMTSVAESYEAIGRAAMRAADVMRALETLPAAPHDPNKRDAARFAAWMNTKIDLQRNLAAMLLEHAEQSLRALEQMR